MTRSVGDKHKVFIIALSRIYDWLDENRNFQLKAQSGFKERRSAWEKDAGRCAFSTAATAASDALSSSRTTEKDIGTQKKMSSGHGPSGNKSMYNF